jgi:peptidoglycan/LPS O-acetylase OafA/YrhL
MVSSRNKWLDLCRSLAILLVLLGHGRLFLRSSMPWMEYFKFGGFMGVDLFFVLSGFLIGGILIRLARMDSVSWLRGFYIRRWFRTLPNYYLFLLINVVLVLLAIRPGDLGVFWMYPIFVQNLFTPHPLFFPEAWSLAVEEIFYLLFPALFLLFGRVLGLDVRQAILLTSLLVIVLSLGARLDVATDALSWDADIRKIAFLRFDALMYGVLLAWFHDRWGGFRRIRIFSLSAVIIFIAVSAYVAITPDEILDNSYFAKTLLFSMSALGCVGIIVIGLNWILPRPLATASEFLAKVSYSAYLVNIPVAFVVVKVGGGRISGEIMWLIFMVTTLALSYLVYFVYERYFNNIRDRIIPAAS